jgi:hypothetical protein
MHQTFLKILMVTQLVKKPISYTAVEADWLGQCFFNDGTDLLFLHLRRCIKKFPDYFHRPQTDGTT